MTRFVRQQVVTIYSLPAICVLHTIFQYKHRVLCVAHADNCRIIPTLRQIRERQRLLISSDKTRLSYEAIACMSGGVWLSNPHSRVLRIVPNYGIKSSLYRPNDRHCWRFDSSPREWRRCGPCLQVKKIRFLSSRAFSCP